MREYDFNITPFFRYGLPTRGALRNNLPFLRQAKNVVIREGLLETYEDLVDPFDGTEAFAFPFPQVVVTATKTFLFYQTTIKEVDESLYPLSASSITTYSIADGTTPQAIVSGGIWHFAIFGKVLYAFNGACIVFISGLDTLHGVTDRLFVATTPTVSTGIEHNGRILMGGFNANDFWTSTWGTLFTSWKASLPTGANVSEDEIDGSYIFWSSVGDGNFPLWLSYPDIYDYDLSPTEDDIIKIIARNDFGYMKMPLGGTVLGFLPIGNDIAVFTDKCVVLITPYINENASGYGVKSVHRIGCAGRDCFAGSGDIGYFISTQGKLWGVTSQGFLELGYEEFLLPELDGDLYMLYDDNENLLRISGSKQYILSGKHMTHAVELVSGTITNIYGHFGIATPGIGDDADYVELESGVFDFGRRQMKTISSILVDISSEHTAEVSYAYRYNRTEAFEYTNWVSINSDGYAFHRITAVEFKVRIRIKGKSDTYISNGKIKYQLSDNRYTRGPEADGGLINVTLN